MLKRGPAACPPRRERYVSDKNFDYLNEFEDFGSPRKSHRRWQDEDYEVPKGVKLNILTF